MKRTTTIVILPKTPIKRTPFMTFLMEMSHGLLALEAIERGWDGAMERLVAKSLKKAVERGESEAEVLLQATGGNYLKAAYLITSSKI